MKDFYCDEVLSGKTPVEVVRETENFLAFHHTRPSYPAHIVVIPKAHIPSFVEMSEVDDAWVLEMINMLWEVAAEVEMAHGKCRVVTNMGAYQESKHLHWHVIAGEFLK